MSQCPDLLRRPQSGDRAETAGAAQRYLVRLRDTRSAVPIIGLALLGLLVAGCTSTEDDKAGSPTSVAVAPRTSAPLIPAPSDAAMPGKTAAELQSLLDAWVAGDNGVGVTAAVVSAAGTWSGTAGVDGTGDPLVPESAMAIGSMTKTFVAAEVMQLAGQGRVDLDAPISDYVTVPFDPQGATVRQVLSMRSGFPLDPVDKALEAVEAELDRSWTTDEFLALVDAEGPRQGSVGGSADYNNLNYVVLVKLIEKVTGQPWSSALRQDLIDPAGLDRVWVQDAEQPQPPLTVGVVDPEMPVVDPDGPWLPSRSMATLGMGAGGIAADAPSMARWGYLLYGGHVIDSSLVQQMTAGGPDDWYGLGTQRITEGSQLSVGHAGNDVSYHGRFWVWPDQATSIAVLVPAPARTPVIDIDTTADQLLDQLARATLDK
jgi:D-alanyl-D-alanine carboxypeptidase